MDREQALAILRCHQPLPADDVLPEDWLADFDAARAYFAAHPDAAAVPLLLGGLGDGSGHGVYQLVEDAIHPLPAAVVLPHLRAALQSPRPWARTWAAEIAMGFPDPSLIPLLAPMLLAEDEDDRCAAASTLSFIPHLQAGVLLREAYARTRDEFLGGIVADLDGRAPHA